MPDTAVRAQLSVTGGPAALAELRAFRQAVAEIGSAKSQASLGVDASALTKAKAEVSDLGAKHQSLGAKPVTLGMDISDITKARSAMQGLDGDVLSLIGSMSKLAAPAALAGIGVGATKLASDFQTLTTNIQNNTTASSADIAGMNATIKQLSSDSGASLQSLAGGWMHAFNIMGNGADAAKVLSVAMESAVSTGSDVSATADALAKTIHQFGDSAADAAKDMDILHLAAAMGNTTLEQFIGASAKSMVTAASLGVGLKDVSSAYVALTRAGFDAGEANTQIAALLTHLIKPSAEAKVAIADLAKTTGIDLTNDFSLAGVQSKGLVGVLGDIRAATNGQEDAVLKLIPAQRGGIGALALTTSAYKDATDASQQFNRVISGELTPTADAYARTQQTLGNQAAIMGQQFKQLGIDLGGAAVGPLTDLLRLMNGLPDGVKKAGVEIGLAALAIKTAGAAADALTAGAARLGTSIAGDTAATVADTAALEGNTVALEANAVARGAAGTAAAKNAVATEAATVETAGVAATIGTAVTGIGKTLGRLIVPVSIGLIAYEIIGKPVEDAIRQKVSEIERPQANLDTLNTDDEATFEAGIRARLDQQQKIVDEYNDYQGSKRYTAAKILNLGGELQSDRDYKNALANIATLKAAEEDYQKTHHNTVALGPPVPENLKRGGPSPFPSEEEQKQLDADAKASAQNLADYRKALDKDVEDARKQARADAVTAEKARIQEAGDAQIAAAKASADAWKAAGSEVAKVDLSKGLQSLVDAAPGLDRVQLALAQLGTGDVHLDNLTQIAKRFADISDAEKAASAAYNGFLLTLDQTDKRVASIDALKTRLIAAVDAAQQAQLRGTATPADRATIAGAPAAFAQLNQAEVQLKGNASQDWAGIIANLPEWLKGQLQADASTRTAVGNGKELLTTVTVETTAAAQDLDKFEKEDRQAIIKITADTKAAKDAVDAFLLAIPSDKTVRVQYTQPDGTPVFGPLPGEEPAAPVGYARPQTIRSVGGGPYGNETLAQGGGGGGSTATPRGDASALLPYASVIQKAADAYGVPAWMLGAIILHESGGVPGKVEVGGGLGRGLTQVDLGQHPDQYAHQKELTGTDPTSIAYQINKGAEILAGALKASGGNPQGYAGSAYRSQAGGGVPAGLDFGTELSTYYKAPVQAVLGGQSDGGGGAEVPPATVSSVRQQIVNEALKSLNQTKLVNYCEEFVEETVQAITGKRGATGRNESTATSAFLHAQSMGLETKNPQPGDLVYYPDANGGPGHVAVYQGRGQQISTADVGGTAIHTEAVGPNARYISVGLPADTPSSRAATGYGPGTYSSTGGTPSSAGLPSAATLQELANATAHVDVAARGLKETFAHMDSRDVAAATAQFQKMAPILDQMAHAGDTDITTTTTKAEETAGALRKNLDLTNLWAHALTDIRNGSTDIASVQEKITATIGGPLAQNLNAQLSVMRDQHATASQINLLTERRAALEKAHAAEQAANAAADRASARQQTMQQWADQDADTARQHARRVAQERDAAAYTAVQRGFEDRSRALQFSQQVGATDLQNRLTDLQKSQQSTIYQRTSQEQLVSAQVAGAGTNQEAGVLAARLAAMHDQDLAQKDLNTKAIDDIQMQIREEAKRANLESYNLETERIAATRAHEDHLAQVQSSQAAEDEAIAASRQARDRAHQEEQWQIEDARAAQDAAYQNAISSIDDEIKKQQELATTEQDALTALQSAWDAFGQSVSADLSNLAAGFTQATQGDGGGTAPLPGWSPAPIRTLGGQGEAMTPVMPVAPQSSAANGLTVSLSFGDINMGVGDDEETFIKRVHSATEPQLRDLYRKVTQAGRTRMGALGLN